MGDSVANAVGKGPALILTVDGKEYTLAPLKMEDLADVELEAKKRRRADVLQTIKDAGDLLTPEDRREMIKELAVESDSWQDFLTTPSAVEFVLAIRLRRSYPEMTEQEARSLITLDALAQIEIDLIELVGLDAFMGKGEGDASPPESG